MSNVIAKIMVFGDSHLSSKNYGGHRNYPEESLFYLNKMTEIAEEQGVTHMIGLGDLTYGRFHTIEYREKVDEILVKQRELTCGNRYELMGNHDIATYGKTERDYYVKRGLIRPSENIQIGAVNINMVDFGKYNDTDVIIEEDKINMVLTHGYFIFEDTQLPNYGNPVYLDNFEKWYGVNYIICGHIHNEHRLSGRIIKDGRSVDTLVHYLPCLSRPSYTPELLSDTGTIVILDIMDDGTMQYNYLDVPLWDIAKSFNVAMIEKKKQHKESVAVDITDVVQRLNNHERVIGNPEDIISSMNNVDIKYRLRAIELLKQANS